MARTPLPWMQWFPDDHLNDRSLRACERGTRSDWVDMCSVMWMRREPFLLGTPAQLSRVIGVTPDEMATTIADLFANGAADVEPAPQRIAGSVACVVSMGVTYRVTSRRLTRVMRAREANAKRQERFRNKARDADANGNGDAYSNGQGELPLMDADDNAQHDAGGAGDSNASASDLSEAVETQTSESSSLTRAGARWTAAHFREAWTRITHKTSMCAPELAQQAADLCLDSAQRLHAADPVAHCERLIAAFPALVAWYPKASMTAPQVNIAKFVDLNHFGRCEDIVTGALDLEAQPERAKAAARVADPRRGMLPVAKITGPDEGVEDGAIVTRRR